MKRFVINHGVKTVADNQKLKNPFVIYKVEFNFKIKVKFKQLTGRRNFGIDPDFLDQFVFVCLFLSFNKTSLQRISKVF